ncbi:hypothetical protein SAMN06295879_3500 [Agreia bicolorata]|uniref:Uncharacterized protein n=1 Tax=Agreia bicolorata TaxID=110935 RepID=A0A1T4YKW5_9MICO|nr:hypothetical protein [Agreia bicolorata]SKB02422.1 hypothetical protein SAMN06295879_3500 [Agreia bicolorata]
MKRPISIYLGVLLILLRTVTTIVTAVSIAVDWKKVDISLDVGTGADAEALSSALLIALMILFGIAVVIDLAVAGLIFRGSNRARFVALVLATILVLGSAADFFVDGTSFTLENGGLLGLSLDILVLVALSDSDARDFTTSNSNGRRDARRSRRLLRRAGRHPGISARTIEAKASE